MKTRLITVSLLFLVGALSVPDMSTGAGNGDTTGTIAFAGGKLEYYIQGTGVPCVVYNIPRFYQRSFSTELRKHLKLIFLDSRMSVPTTDSYDWRTVTMDTLVDDIENLRKILGFEKICIIGHSLNGAIAVEYARKYPEHTSHAVMIGTPPFFKELDSVANTFWDSMAGDERKQNLKRNWERFPQKKFKELSPSRAFAQNVINDTPKYFFDSTYDPSRLVEGEYWNIKGLEQIMSVILGEYDISLGKKIVTPCFLAVGKYDFVVPVSMWDNKKTIFQNLSYNLFEKSGHFPMLEEQELFDKKLMDWIKSQ